MAGAEFGVRGYIAAYDAADGEELWRFYTVPGDEGDDAPEYLKAAAETWSGDALAGEDGIGGGGTVWDSMAYDPELDLLYFGVGNGSPWNRAYRSPGPDGRGEGDNLYLSSIVAIRPDTGEYVWHYQTTPGETWDYTATQHIVLADMEIDGRDRQVLMQAPKNGYFYVLDRATGEFISAEPYIPLNWSTGMSADGRPQMNPETRIDVTGKPALVMPGPLGGHNWHPMAYHPGENLVYIPAFEAAMLYAPETNWKPDRARGFNIGFDLGAGDLPPDLGIRREVQGTIKGQAGGVGSGGAGSALERRTPRPVERRPAGDRRRSGLPGQFGQRVRRLQFGHGRPAVALRRADRCGRPTDHLHGEWRTICRGAGRMGRRIRAVRRWRADRQHASGCATSAACWCSSWAAPLPCLKNPISRSPRSTRRFPRRARK